MRNECLFCSSIQVLSWFCILHLLKCEYLKETYGTILLKFSLTLCLLCTPHESCNSMVKKLGLNLNLNTYHIFLYTYTLLYWHFNIQLSILNKANLRDLIAGTSLVILNKIQIDFSADVTLKFDRWPWKTIGNPFHAPKSYVCHFIAIHDCKLKLSSGNAQIGAKSSIFRPPVIWNLTDNLEK